MTESNVTSIGQNGRASLEGSAAEIYEVQQRRIELQQRRIEQLEEEQQREPLTLKEALDNLQPDEEYEPVYEVRKLNRADFKRLIGMVRKVRNNESLQSSVASGDQAAMMSDALDVLLTELEGDFMPWLQDLAGKAEVADEELPFGFDIDVLNDLKNNDNFLGALRSAIYFVMTGKRLFGR